LSAIAAAACPPDALAAVDNAAVFDEDKRTGLVDDRRPDASGTGAKGEGEMSKAGAPGARSGGYE
jgi:hypothetical protein